MRPRRFLRATLTVASVVLPSLSATLSACGGSPATEPPSLRAVTIAPDTLQLPAQAYQRFTLTGNYSDGSSKSLSADWSASGGTIAANGLYASGATPGEYTVTGAAHGTSLSADAHVTLYAATLSQLAITPSLDTVGYGDTVQFSASAQWSGGGAFPPVMTWSALGGTITSSGRFVAGNAAGSFRVIGTGLAGPRADTSTIVVRAPIPDRIILTPSAPSLATGGTQQFTVKGVFGSSQQTLTGMDWSVTGGSITPQGLYTAGSSAGRFRVIASYPGAAVADTSVVTITSSSATVLVDEGFEDASASSRGWFDLTTLAIASGGRPGSTGTHALEWHWRQGDVKPLGSGGSGRHDFAPSDGVYLSYWVRQSSNWVGSMVSYDPHMFHIITTVDAPTTGSTPGPSRSHLTLYNELNYVVGSGGSRAHAAMQDALNINPTYLNQDVSPGHTPTTENRAVSGYNGQPESGFAFWDTYQSGGLFFNGKWWASNFPAPGTLVMTDATKNSWHHIETYYQLNSVVGGVGQRDGVLQYWFDGTLLADRHDIYYRTGQYPDMKFRQFIMAPYMSPNGGTGSPVDQYMWIDDLLIATAKP